MGNIALKVPQRYELLKIAWRNGVFTPFATTDKGINHKQVKAFEALRGGVFSEVMFGGGARGGKSWLGCTWALFNALTMPRSEWMVIRNTLTRIKETTFPTFLKVIRAYGVPSTEYEIIGANSGASVKFKNGSRILFRGGLFDPSDPEYSYLGSYDLTGVFLEECQEVKRKLVSVLYGRFSVLEGNGWKTKGKMFMTCNPYRNWIFSEFYDAQRNGTIESYKTFIPSLVTDNPNVDASYIENLRKADEITMQRLLMGNFDYDDSKNVMVSQSVLQSLRCTDVQIDFKNRYITADIAHGGADKFVVMVWFGRVVIDIHILDKASGKKVIDTLKAKAAEYDVPTYNIVYDADGLGNYIGGEDGFLEGAVNFHNGGKVFNGKPYANLKTQCIYETVELMSLGQLRVSESIPASIRAKLDVELLCWRRANIDSEGKLHIESKAEMKELNGGASPDIADAFMMRRVFDLRKIYNTGFHAA